MSHIFLLSNTKPGDTVSGLQQFIVASAASNSEVLLSYDLIWKYNL